MPVLLQINATANWGSTGKIAESIGLCAKSHGWDSYIAYGRYSNKSESSLIKVGCKFETYLHFAFAKVFDLEGLCSILPTIRLIRTIKRIKPDIVHLHNIHDHWLNYKLLFNYLNQTDIKVVWTFHDCWAFTGHCAYFDSVNCNKWQSECNKCPYRLYQFDNTRKNYLLKQTIFTSNPNLTIVACSEWLANFVKASFFKDKQVFVIHNGINLKVFNQLKVDREFRGKSYRLIAVASVWETRKGLNDIIRLRSLLPVDFEILIVGLTEKQVDLLPEGINGTTRINNVQDLVKVYNDADVFINPTYEDNFPTVNLEALACGKSVVTYRTGGSPEAIDNLTGIVVDCGDVDAMADAIRYLRLHPLSAENCRKRAEIFFDADRCFERYFELYSRTIN